MSDAIQFKDAGNVKLKLRVFILIKSIRNKCGKGLIAIR